MRILRKHLLKLVEYSGGEYDEDGNYFSGVSPSAEFIRGCVQPDAKGIWQSNLPEGVSSSDTRILWTETKLKTTDEFNKTQADVLEYEGITYEVFRVSSWNGASRIKAFEALLIRKDKL